MFRSTSVLALLAAMSLPAMAADYDEWGEPEEAMPDFRSTYSGEPKDWSELGDSTDPVAFEFGTRYWYSMGAVSASASGGTVSSGDTTHMGEVHLRIDDHSTNSYAKAMIGYSIATTGTYTAPLESGPISDGHVTYAGGDFGWSAIGDNQGSGAGFLVGYQYWQEALNTGRNNFTTATSAGDIGYDPMGDGQTLVPLDSATNSLDVHALRLGVQGKMQIGGFLDVTAEVAAVPYAKVSGVVGIDDPTFDTSDYNGAAQPPYSGVANGNISSIRSSPTELDGWGYGAMGELWLGVRPTENMTFRLGGRAWYLQGNADATYTRAFIGNPTDVAVGDPNYDTDPTFVNAGFIDTTNPFALMRYGILGEFTYNF